MKYRTADRLILLRARPALNNHTILHKANQHINTWLCILDSRHTLRKSQQSSTKEQHNSGPLCLI